MKQNLDKGKNYRKSVYNAGIGLALIKKGRMVELTLQRRCCSRMHMFLWS